MSKLTFVISKKQVKRLEKWREKIRDLHGEVGNEEFIFEPCSIGTGIIVKNKTYNIELDLTDIGEW